MKASIRSLFRNHPGQSEIPAPSKNVLGRSCSVFYLLLVLFSLGRIEAVGQIWDNRASANDNAWNSITYGNGVFVAVAANSGSSGNNRVMTSTDGITWTQRSVSADNWVDVTYGSWSASVNNKLLISNVATLTTSAAHNFSEGQSVTITGVDATFNGTYTILTVPSTTSFTYAKSAADVSSTAVSPLGTASAGLFVATASRTSVNYVMTSPDGTTWTNRTANAGDWNGLAYGNGVFVAVNTGITQVMTSPDGINWTYGTPAQANSWRGLTFGNGLFVAVSTNGTNRVMTSTDGLNWISRNQAANNSWGSVVYGNGLFVAVSRDGTGNRVMTSPDGITWTSRTSAADNTWYEVTFGDGRFIAVASSGSGNRVMTSTDGINWSIEIPATNNDWRSMTYGNGRFVAVSNTGTGNRVMTRDSDLSADLNAPFLGTTGDGDAMSSYVFQFALPLSLLDFTGERVASSVRLRWKTAWEQGTSHFEVERSTNGMTFLKAGTVKAAGNSDKLRSYEFMDDNAPTGTLHYRLRQVDADGKFSYSNIVRVRLDGRSSVSIGPNPTAGQATLRLPSGWTGLYECRIINASGAVVYRKEDLRAGSHTLDLSRWAPGLYRVTLWENGESVDQQWIMRR